MNKKEFTKALFKAYVAKLVEAGFLMHLEEDGPSAVGKYLPPSSSTEWLGLIIDILNRTLDVTPDRKARYKQLTDDILAKDTVDAKTLSTFAGQATSCTIVCPEGATYLRHVWKALKEFNVYKFWGRGVTSFNPDIPVNKNLLTTLRWWSETYSNMQPKRICFVDGHMFLFDRYLLKDHPKIVETIDDKHFVIIRSDASGGDSGKWGVTVGDVHLSGTFPDHFIERQKDIGIREFFAVLCALREPKTRELIKNKFVVVHTDNMTTRRCVNKLTSNHDAPFLYNLILELHALVKQASALMVARHIPGILNTTPDSLTRYAFILNYLDLYPNRFILKVHWDKITSILPHLQVEGFAERKTSRLEYFCTKERSFYDHLPWLIDGRVWCFPPRHLTIDTLKICRKLLKKAPVPFIAIMISEEFVNQVPYLVQALFNITEFKAGTRLFANPKESGVENSMHSEILPPTDQKYVVLSTRKSEDWRKSKKNGTFSMEVLRCPDWSNPIVQDYKKFWKMSEAELESISLKYREQFNPADRDFPIRISNPRRKAAKKLKTKNSNIKVKKAFKKHR